MDLEVKSMPLHEMVKSESNSSFRSAPKVRAVSAYISSAMHCDYDCGRNTAALKDSSRMLSALMMVTGSKIIAFISCSLTAK
jgi:hypothetical protein